MRRLLQFLKKGLYNQGEVSSKRIVMYVFTLVALFMILTEAVFNSFILYKFFTGLAMELKFRMVFDTTIYTAVFGTIGAMAGINGFGKQVDKPQTRKVDETQ